ncbi:DegV family protein [Desulforamulus aquiferis]|uniref:DegV family protein n=1 Tax=Desulforamulus aquiferis TaxID=1397668 RepID=A0AAW7ZGF0_9FIRM|nr:DegV family protein [Desulforamulus aquiferis]MDO7788777.1 DegV family protein [Desulforamulus aquiferis]
MPPVRIVTDSTADLTDDLLKRFNISRVPLKVLFEREVYKDGEEIKPDVFYERLKKGEFATTSQPSPGEFAKVFQELVKDGSEVICLTLSGQFSGTYQSAQVGKKMVTGDIEIVDTMSASWGVGLMAIAAARAAAEGKSKQEILRLLNSLVSKMKVLFLVDSLDHLERGGRIGKAQAFLGTLLSIKPLLCINDGIVCPYEKIRGRDKGLERMVQIVEQQTKGAKINCAIINGGDPEAGEALYKKVINRLECQEVWQGDIGSVIGSHVGPVSGIIYYSL